MLENINPNSFDVNQRVCKIYKLVLTNRPHTGGYKGYTNHDLVLNR